MRRTFLALLAAGWISFGHGVTVVGSGHAPLPAIKVVPGQLTTFLVTGLKTVLPVPIVRAKATPLPSTLAGISVALVQTGGVSYTAPVLSIQQMSQCAAGSSSGSGSAVAPECLTTAITVQVPFELKYVGAGGAPIDTQLLISENGDTSEGFSVTAAFDNLHILNTCDTFVSGSQPPAECMPLAAHGDGTLITADSPASPGEEIVLYAYGLPKTPQVPVQTGVPTPSGVTVPASFLETFGSVFDLSPNAAPKDVTFASAYGPIPYAGLVPGEIGLFQINVPLPANLITSFACDGRIHSNLTVNIRVEASSDGAPICIRTSASSAL
jgi:uncharacterized protein (TIGR03437 family)